MEDLAVAVLPFGMVNAPMEEVERARMANDSDDSDAFIVDYSS